MSLEPRCLDTPKDRKKKPKPPSSGDCGGSTHAKQKIGLFEVTNMMKCMAEINGVEAETERRGTWLTSRNKICRISSDIPLSCVSLEEVPS